MQNYETLAVGDTLGFGTGTGHREGTVAWLGEWQDHAGLRERYAIVEVAPQAADHGHSQLRVIAIHESAAQNGTCWTEEEKLGIAGTVADVERLRRILAQQYAAHPAGLYEGQ